MFEYIRDGIMSRCVYVCRCVGVGQRVVLSAFGVPEFKGVSNSFPAQCLVKIINCSFLQNKQKHSYCYLDAAHRPPQEITGP